LSANSVWLASISSAAVCEINRSLRQPFEGDLTSALDRLRFGRGLFRLPGGTTTALRIGTAHSRHQAAGGHGDGFAYAIVAAWAIPVTPTAF